MSDPWLVVMALCAGWLVGAFFGLVAGYAFALYDTLSD